MAAIPPYEITLGGSCAIDSIEQPFFQLLSLAPLPLHCRWASYGRVWMPREDISLGASQSHIGFVRAEDYILSHPELLSNLEQAGLRARGLVKSAREVDVAARRAAKHAKKRRTDSLQTPGVQSDDGSAQTPHQATTVATTEEIVQNHLRRFTLPQLQAVASEVIKSLLLTVLGIQGSQTEVGAQSAATDRHTFFLPTEKPRAGSCEVAWKTIQRFERAVDLCLQACRAGAPSQTGADSCQESNIQLEYSFFITEAGESRQPHWLFKLHCSDSVASWQAEFEVPEVFNFGKPSLHALAQHSRMTSSSSFMDDVPETVSSEHCFDPVGAVAAHNPYKPQLWALAARRVLELVHMNMCIRPKVVVLDCDNTLWEGAVGELGAAGVSFSHRCLQVQSFAAQLKERGMLLAISSRNELADVKRVFDMRSSEMKLSAIDIVAWKVNWQRKSDSIVEIAAELNLGLDSFIFIDDNPVETAEVNSRLGDGSDGVTTVLLPQIENWGRFLRNHWLLSYTLKAETTASDEDEARTLLYQQSIVRGVEMKKAASFPAFLASLNLKVDIVQNDTSSAERIAQLTERTNQFNAAKSEWTEMQVLSSMKSGSQLTLSATVTDRFGCYGLVGVVVLDPNSDHTSAAASGSGASYGSSSAAIIVSHHEPTKFEQYGKRIVRVGQHPAKVVPLIRVHQFLMSCRILHRGVEHAQLRAAARHAQQSGAVLLGLRWIPSDRNEPAARFFFGSLKQHITFVPDILDQGVLKATESNSVQRHNATQKTPITSKPPLGWIYIPVQAALSAELRPEDADVEEVFGSSSDDARQAAKVKKRVLGSDRAAATRGATSTETSAAASPHVGGLAVANSRGIKLKASVYEQLALFNTGLPPSAAEAVSYGVGSERGFVLDEHEISAATEAELQTKLQQFPSFEAQSMLHSSEAFEAFKVKQVLEKQAQHRRKMRLQAKVLQQDRLQGE